MPRPKETIIPYNPSVLERVQRIWETQRRRELDARPRTPEQRAAEAELDRGLREVENSLGIDDQGPYVLLTEIGRIFGMKPKAVKGFCERHHVPTNQKPRRFEIGLIAFATAYAQDTNVRTDAAIRRRVQKCLAKRDLLEKLEHDTRAYWGK